MRTMIVALSTAVFALSGCVSAERSAAKFNSNQGVTIGDITGAIKCAFAEALKREQVNDKRLQRLHGRVAAIELTLKVVDTSDVNGKVGAQAAGPFLVTTSAGQGSILPSFGGGKVITNTLQTVVRYRLGLKYGDDTVCAAQKPTVDYGFSQWLATLIQGLDTYALYEPEGIVDSADYYGNFQIVRKVNGGVKFDIVFVGGDVNASQSNDATQQIKMTIQPPSKLVPFPYPGGPGIGRQIVVAPGAGIGRLLLY